MPVSATDFMTGIIGRPSSGQADANFGNNGITWSLPYVDGGSGNQSFVNGAGTTTAPTPTYTNPE